MTEARGWYQAFVAAVVARLPSEIDEATARRWIEDPDGLGQVLDGLVSVGTIARTFKQDKTKDGWQLLEDVTEPEAISGEGIELATFQAADEEDIFGDEVVTRVQELEGILGQRHVEYLLDHQHEIPDDFQQYSLVFAGTIWHSPDGNHQVPCAVWRQGNWELTFGILEGGLDSRDRLVRARA